VNLLGLRVEGQQESFLAFFGVVRSGFVDEAKGLALPRYVYDLTQIQRPETE